MKSLLLNIGKKSKKAFLCKIKSQKKDQVLKDFSQLIKKNKNNIIKENQKDIKNAKKKN